MKYSILFTTLFACFNFLGHLESSEVSPNVVSSNYECQKVAYPSLSYEQVVKAAEVALDKTYAFGERFLALQKVKLLTRTKWEHFLRIVWDIQLDVIEQFGYPRTHGALVHFLRTYTKFLEKSEELEAIRKKKWAFAYDSAFGSTNVITLNDEQATELVKGFSEKMLSQEFLDRLDQLAKDYKDVSCMIERKLAFFREKYQAVVQVLKELGYQEEDFTSIDRALHKYRFSESTKRYMKRAYSEMSKHFKVDYEAN